MRKPNLFIIGSMKSGTTYLSELLGAHPSIFMCRPKEPSHFVNPDHLRKLWPYMWEQGYWRNEETYLDLFLSAGSTMFLAEASVYYSHVPQATGVPRRISLFNPNARLIYVIRDPIERTISHYWHQVGHHGEYRHLLDAVKTETAYRDVSYYAMQLRAYFDYFQRDQIKILTFEELTGNPSESINSLFQWLGVESPLRKIVSDPANVTPEIVKVPTFVGVLHKLWHETLLFRTVADRIPKPIRNIASRALEKSINRLEVNVSTAIDYLRPLQVEQTHELSELIGRKFPEWTTLSPPLRLRER
jgi:hypothetical protein